jgi:hypothetical protein
VRYASGFGWAKAGEIKSQAEWRAYLEAFAGKLK